MHVLIVCIVFAILYSLSMIYAVLIGATGGQVPSDSAWFRDIHPIHLYYLTEALFTTFLPLFVVVNLNTILLRYVNRERGHTLKGFLIRLFLGVLLAFPLLYVTVALYILPGFIIGWWMIIVIFSGIASGFLVVYQICILVLYTENPRQYLRDCVTNPKIWIAVIVFTGVLLLPSAMLVNPLHKGYFRYFPTHEQFLLNLPDLIMRTSLIGVLLSLVQYGLLHFVGRSEYQVKPSTGISR
ncbi:MAG: hypothetical protein KAQ65_05575 [Candidatus Thorarchaeota archaeon]|nr:hypothetical protein [Candidatus Thorarchaeota archaeon]